MAELFEDAEGGYYLTASDAEKLIVRPKETYDGALPSGNSAAAFVLERLYRITAEPAWGERLDRQLAFLSGDMAASPASHTFGLIAAMPRVYPSREIVALLRDEGDKKALVEATSGVFAPFDAIAAATPGERSRLATIAPFTRDYRMTGGQPTFYICRGNACEAPFTGIDELKRRLERNEGSEM